jgi:hypothetical protein
MTKTTYMLAADGEPTKHPILTSVWNQAVDAFNRGHTSTIYVTLSPPVGSPSTEPVAPTVTMTRVALRVVHDERGYGLYGLRFASDGDQRLYEAWAAKFPPPVNLCIDCARHRDRNLNQRPLTFCTRYFGAAGKEARAICKGDHFERPPRGPDRARMPS